MKLVNGRPIKAVVEITNHDSKAIDVAFVAGILATTKELPEDAPAYEKIVRNLTSVPYDLKIEAGEKKELPYSFAIDMNPQDVLVQLIAVITDSKGTVHQVQASNSTASIVEAPTSFLDPQMYVHSSPLPRPLN